MKKTVFAALLLLTALAAIACSAGELNVNEELRDQYIDHTPGETGVLNLIGRDPGSVPDCGGRHAGIWRFDQDSHWRICARCGEELSAPAAHTMDGKTELAYAVIDGELCVVKSTSCKCSGTYRYEFIPYDESETTG